MGKRTTPFTCFYCGKAQPAEESSDEHIVPTSIGGTRNATLTDEVCRTCNAFMSEHVDLPFSRDWLIESARLLAGITNKGKEPVLRMGRLEWARPESASVFVTQEGVSIFVVDGTPDGRKRLLIGLDDSKPDLVEHTRKVIKARFAGIPVANDASSVGKPYEEGIIEAIRSLGTRLPLKIELSIVAWHREFVKIALGLACKVLGAPFITSDDAQRLREFLFEDDYEKRAAMQLRGVVGVGTADVTPRLTSTWHPGGEEHLFALLAVPNELGLAFVGNLFGKYENTIQVSTGLRFNDLLPNGPLRGAAWIVDGGAKTTTGPLPLSQLLKLG